MRTTCSILLLFIGCAGEADARPQTVLYIDTDVPVPRIADTLRVEILAPDGTASELREYVLPNAMDWPVSLGIVPREDGAPTRLRLRLFGAARLAGLSPSALSTGLDPEDPLPAFVIDRLVTLAVPDAEVRHVEVVLFGDCLGLPADLSSERTCVTSSDLPLGEPGSGLTELDAAPDVDAQGRPGSWPAAVSMPCSGTPRPDLGANDDELCVEGGVFFMGDSRLALNPITPETTASVPERLVQLSPFYMDRTEVTVRRVRAVVAEGFDLDAYDWVGRDEFSMCNFTPSGITDDLPMNCVDREFAMAFCAADGGRLLPSEAQWEYAASSRGEERLYAWGSSPPACDDAVFSRVGMMLSARFGFTFDDSLDAPGQCAHLGEGAQPVSLVPRDRTIDGLVDMGGNVQEWTRDSLVPFSDPCWDQPRLVDPVCDDGGENHVLRGGAWAAPTGALPVALRKSRRAFEAVDPSGTFSGFAIGFRCVRPAA